MRAGVGVPVVRLANRTIQVLPKLYRSDSEGTRAHEATPNLLHLLVYEGNLRQRELQTKGYAGDGHGTQQKPVCDEVPHEPHVPAAMHIAPGPLKAQSASLEQLQVEAPANWAHRVVPACWTQLQPVPQEGGRASTGPHWFPPSGQIP